MLQGALTVIAKIRPGEDRELERLLDIIGGDIKGKRDNTYLRLSDISTLHFGRFVLIPDMQAGGYAYLMMETNHDGPLRAHTDEFVDKAGEAMDLLWGKCEGYPTVDRKANPDRFKRAFHRFIVKNSIEVESFYMAYRYETVGQVKWYAEFHDAVQRFVDLRNVEEFISDGLKDLIARIPKRPVREAPPLLRPLVGLLRKIGDWLGTALGRLIFLLDAIRRIVSAFTFRPLKRLILRREPALDLKLSDAQIQPGLADIEDVVTQNQLTVISAIKPGTLRDVKIVLNGIHIAAKHIFNKGSLGTIATIHFARWCIIDKGRYLLFFSNYDGSWDSYIGDFVDKAATGMDAIWRSAPGYPEQGSIDIDAFKSIIRRNQVRTQVFYSAYPDRTVQNILRDREVARPFYQEDVVKWMGHL